MRGARGLKNLTLVLGIVLSGLVLLAWTGTWFTVTLRPAATTSTLSVTGDVAAPGLIGLALAGLALVAALAIAGRVFRVVLGVLEVLIGFTTVLSSILALGDPVGASSAAITKASGISGRHSVAGLVESVSVSAWPALGVVFGALLLLLGVFILVTGHRWPTGSRRYQPVRLEEDGGDGSRVSDWDRLSGGGDPTSR